MPYWIIGLIAFFVFDIVLVIYIVIKRSCKKSLDGRALQYIKAHWIRIIDMFNNNTKGAILDADKLLDYALERHGYDGHLGEKLKKGKGHFSDLNGVWFAHKLRNKVAHELGDINMKDARNALKNFKRALNDLGAGL